MQRYKASIENGKIPQDHFLAINPFEPVEVVSKFIKKNSYPFTFIDDFSNLSHVLKIKATPTVTFIDKNQVVHQSTGISFIGILRAEWFFRP